MLALSRKKNEAIVINNNVEITVLEIKGDQVKLGISAPKEVPVYRKESCVKKQFCTDYFMLCRSCNIRMADIITSEIDF